MIQRSCQRPYHWALRPHRVGTRSQLRLLIQLTFETFQVWIVLSNVGIEPDHQVAVTLHLVHLILG